MGTINLWGYPPRRPRHPYRMGTILGRGVYSKMRKFKSGDYIYYVKDGEVWYPHGALISWLQEWIARYDEKLSTDKEELIKTTVIMTLKEIINEYVKTKSIIELGISKN